MAYCVQIQEICKKFSDTCEPAIDHLTLDIPQGKIVGLIGADGAGKTTLLRLISGLLQPTEGSIRTLGLNPTTKKEKLNQLIGYMPQKFGLYEDLSVINNLNFFAAIKNVTSGFDELLEFAGLLQFKKRLAGRLSGGMKQKLGLICALVGHPDLILLDEPSVGVDPVSRRELLQLVKENVKNKSSVIWATAYMDEAHSFDSVIVLHQGKVVYQGNPYDLAKDTASFEEKIIELTGGYTEDKSLVAKNYKVPFVSIENTVEALDLVKQYGDFYAVKNNTFYIKKGEIFGLLGPNGAGKSTSFKMMCGLAKPTAGTAKIMGIDIVKEPENARSHLGYMAQKFSLYANLSVRQNLNFFARAYGLYGDKLENAVTQMVNVFKFKKYLDINAGELPLGYKQRLSLACALMHNPAVLFLDEPTSGVDVISRREFWNHIRALAQKGVTILITTHFMDEAEFCNRISLFYNGETIATGTPTELKKTAGVETMEEAFIQLILKSKRETQ